MLIRLGAYVAALLAFGSSSEGAAPQAHGVMYHAPRWSADGQWILASGNRDGDSEIYLVRADGGALRQLTHNSVPDDLARWTADGRRIHFVRVRSGREVQLSMNPDGTSVRDEPGDSVVARTLDGRVLLFESTRDGYGRLFVMRANRTGVKAVSGRRHAEQGSFSPDGRLLLYEERDATHAQMAKSDIVIARADGSEPRSIASGTDPSWSPDGGSILFKTFDARTQQLWIATVSPTGTDVRRLAPGVHPQWSPDGQRIVYMRDRDDGGADIWVMNRDGRSGRCVTCAAPFR